MFKTLTDSLLAHRQALFAYWAVCLGIGLSIYYCLPTEPVLLYSLCLAALLFILFAWTRWYVIIRAPAWTWLYFLLHGLLAISLGFARGNIQTYFLNTQFLTTTLKNQTFTATVETAEQTQDAKNRYILTIKKWENHTPDLHIIKKVRLKARTALTLRPGDTVTCTGNLLPLSQPVSPAAYNFKRDYFFKGIGATGTLKSCTRIETNTRPMEHFRHTVTEKIRANMHKPYGDIAAALITGDRSGIPASIRQDFTDAGLAHILAISGLHMGLVAGLLFFLTRRLISTLHLGQFFGGFISEHAPIREGAAVLTILAMAGYLALSGFGYPAIRSFFMTSLIMLGILFCRDPLSMRSLSLAAAIILLLFPESILSASFQLSFAAVLALIAAYEHIGRRFLNKIDDEQKNLFKRLAQSRVSQYFLGITLTTLIATLATTPLSMAIFNRLTLQAILGNLVALPLTAFWIMPCAILSTVSLLFDGVACFFTVFEWGIVFLCKTAAYVAKLPGAGILINTPRDAFFGFFTLGGLLFCIGPMKHLRQLGAASMLASFFFFYNPTLPVGYFSGDRSVIALYDPPYFRVSSQKRGKFFVDQWRSQLAITPEHVVPFERQVLQWRTYAVIADPFKNQIEANLSTKIARKSFLNEAFGIDNPYAASPHTSRIITNSYLPYRLKQNTKKGYQSKQGHLDHYDSPPPPSRYAIHGDMLLKKGAAFIAPSGEIHFQSDWPARRPWS